MTHKKIYLPLIAGVLCAPCGMSQSAVNVTIDHTVKRYLQNSSTGEKVSVLDRDKYFVYHEDTRAAANDEDVKRLMKEYDLEFARNFDGPLKHLAIDAAGKGNSFRNTGPQVNAKLNMMTDSDFEPDQKKALPTRRWVISDLPNNGYINADFPAEKAGRYTAKYFADKYVDAGFKDRVIPEFFEPLNEPLVRANAISTGEIGGKSQASASPDEVVTILSEYYKYAGKYIKQTPALSGMKIVGYAGAYPSFEVNAAKPFVIWKTGMGKFMDIAHEYMDGYSIHIYDGLNVTGESSLRSGSNSEGLLDMIEAYSYKLDGVVKPHIPTEYGGIDHYSDDKSSYNEQSSDLVVGSTNHILYNLLDRQDNLFLAIMFMTGKSAEYIQAKSGYRSYAAVLFKRIASQAGTPYKAAETEWEYTDKIHLFDLWKDVNGDRIEMLSDNPDIQVAGFNDNKTRTLYITLSNLDDKDQRVKLLNGIDNIQSVNIRSLKVKYGDGVTYSDDTLPGMPNEVTLDPDESVIVVVKRNGKVKYKNEVTRTKYYQSSKFLEKGKGETKYTFNIKDLESGDGRGNVRMTLGDNAVSSVDEVMKMFPAKITVNGTPVTIPTNWKGYDQVSRGSFLGMIDVPFDVKLLNEGENVVSFTFPSDSDGYLVSVVLEVETYKSALK